MDDVRKEPEAQEKTLAGAIGALREVADKIDNNVFGARPVAEEKTGKPMVEDALTRARNDINKITEQLRMIEQRLRIIGE